MGTKLRTVSVLIPVYNAGNYLSASIKSILQQNFQDFELIIINDGSTDKSEEIIRSFSDSRIKLISNNKNLGLIASLNIGIKAAKGKYIARMDQDDISLSDRLAKQVTYLETHSDIGIVGTWIQNFDDHLGHILKFPTDPKIIKCWLLFSNTMAHPSVMMRRNFLIKYKLNYDKNYPNVEDYNLWTRSVQYFDIANIPEVLLLYRRHASSISNSNKQIQQQAADKIRQSLLHNIGLSISKKEKFLHRIISTQAWNEIGKFETINQINNWLIKLQNYNKNTKALDQDSLNKVISQHWFLLCNGTTRYGLDVARLYFGSELSESYKPPLKNVAKFMIKCLLKKKLSQQ